MENKQTNKKTSFGTTPSGDSPTESNPAPVLAQEAGHLDSAQPSFASPKTGESLNAYAFNSAAQGTSGATKCKLQIDRQKQPASGISPMLQSACSPAAPAQALGNKRPSADTSPSATTSNPPKMSKDDPLDSSKTGGLYFKMAIIWINYPADVLVPNNVPIIEEEILRNFDLIPVGNEPPLFRSHNLVDGALIYICQDVFTCQWLQSKLDGFLLAHEVQVKVIRYDQLPKVVKLAFWTSDKITKDGKLILKRMGILQPEFNTERWGILDRIVDDQGQGLILLVDRASFSVIKEANLQAFTGADLGFFQILHDPEKDKKLEAAQILGTPPLADEFAQLTGKAVFSRTTTLDHFSLQMSPKQILEQEQVDIAEAWGETAKNMLYSGDKFVERNNTAQCETDSYYFSSYDHFGIHHEMLQDKVRTLAYREAILGNREVIANKKVLDLGCGTAILSMFAASAGAAKVFAIDKSDVIYQAMEIVRENELENEITLVRGRVEDVPLPCKVDIIVSEWMGYFLLFEGMLDSVLFARDKYLAPGGLLMPDRCTLSMVAQSDPDKHQEYVTFWDDVYGYKMSVLKREVVKEANVEDVKANLLCSDPVVIKEFDLFTCTVEDTEFSTKFDLLITKTCKVTSLVGFFDCMFEKGLNTKVTLSTSPTSEPTHWKQTTFLLPDPVEVKAGDQIACRLSCRKNRRDPRTLIVKIDFGKAYNQYYLS